MATTLRISILLLLATLSSSLFFDPTELAQTILDQANQTISNHTSTVTLVDQNGTPTTDQAKAWGCSYDDCMKYSSGPNSWSFITWNNFVPMFSTWLLPWIALTAQLPYETKDKATNLMSLLLALGSPMLAAYSVSLTVLNARWINGGFRREREAWRCRGLRGAPQKQIEAIQAARWILIEIQHIPIRVTKGPHNDFAQVIVRPENAAWWMNLTREISKTKRKKTLSLFMQLGWVIAAQILSIIQFFTTGPDDNSVVLGLAISSLWAWMLPIVWGWVYVGTQNFARSIRNALEAVTVPRITDANGVIQSNCEVLIDRTDDIDESELALFLGFPITGWEREPGPLFVYARVHTHLAACEHIRKAWEALRNKQKRQITVDETSSGDAEVWKANLEGTRDEIAQYILGDTPQDAEKCSDLSIHSCAPAGIGINFIVAGIIALLLQWGTTGSAILIAYQTPVVGLGCDSGAYLFYGVTATVIWCLLVLSAWLSHMWSVRREQLGVKPATWFSVGSFAVLTRLAGNCLAVFNALWVIAFSTLQFTNLYNNCWCASSALQWGIGYLVLLFATPARIFAVACQYWIAGTFMGIVCAGFCAVFFMLAKGDELFRMDAQ